MGDTVRDNDEFVEVDKDAEIIMGEADQDVAGKAVERYETKCNGAVNLRFSIVSYPKDKPFADVLLRLAQERLYKADG